MNKKEQSQRFKEAAKELGADESGEMFERAFKRIVPPKKPKKQHPKPKAKKSGSNQLRP